MKSAYGTLIDELDSFINKFYINKLIKGTLLSLAAIAGFILCFLSIEQFLYLSSSLRLSMLIFLGILFVFSSVFGIIIPLLKIKKIGKHLSYEQASAIIVQYFPEIQDKLLNILQLKSLMDDREGDISLIKAGIDQKVAALTVYKFMNAIPFKQNLKYLKWLAIPVFIGLLIWVVNPGFITTSAQRIVNYSQFFEKPAPYTIEILSQPLETSQQDDFRLEIKVTGSILPDEMFVLVDDQKFMMNKDENHIFYYTFKQLQKDVSFHFSSFDYISKAYILKVLPKPTIFDFQVFLTYPAYMGKPQEIVENNGDLVVPYGTSIRWQIRTKDVETLRFFKQDSVALQGKQQNGLFVFQLTANHDFKYTIIPSNHHAFSNDTLRYQVSVVDDEYPKIDTKIFYDSINQEIVSFYGNISDDYGFSALKFVITGTNQQTNEQLFQNTEKLLLKSGQNPQDFWFTYDLRTINILPGTQISFYFEVADNDVLHGYKSTKSEVFIKKILTQEEQSQLLDQKRDDFEKDLKKDLKDIKQLNKKAEALMQKLMDKKNVSWEEKKAFDELLSIQKQIKENIEEAKKNLEQVHQQENKLSEYDQALLDKQKELEKLFDQLFDEDMRKNMEEMQRLMEQQMPKEKMEQALRDIKMNNAEMQKELDRNLQVFKQLEFEKKMNETVESIQKIKQKQEELRKDIESGQKSAQDALKSQQDIEKDYKSLMQEMGDLQKMNHELESPMDFKRDENLEKNIENDMKDASNNLQKGNQKDASEEQKNVEKGLEKMANQMQSAMDQEEEERQAEDAAMIRRLLKDIVKTSQNQESLMDLLKKTAVSHPDYKKIINEQSKLNNDITVIMDSIYALGVRQPQVATMVNQELKKLAQSSEKAMQSLLGLNTVLYQNGDFKNSSAVTSQQYAMTGLNNLALLLAESLKQMEQKQKQKSGKSGKGKKQKPGQTKSTTSLREMQESLNKQLEQLKKSMQEKQSGMSEQMARAAAQQEAIRRMLQKMMTEQKQMGGKQNGDLNALLQEMEKTEKELVNKTITDQTLKRQKNITTRLLEVERADLQREQEEQRQSKEAVQFQNQIPDALKEYQKQKLQEQEMIINYQPVVVPFYKKKIDDYFNGVK